MNNTILTITADRSPAILLSGISWYKLSPWKTQFKQSQRTETHQFCYRVSPGTNCRHEKHNSNNHSGQKRRNLVIGYLLVQIVAMNNTILTITADRNPAILLSGISWYKLSLWTTQFKQSQRTETQQFCHRVSPGTNCRYEQHNSNNHSGQKPSNFVIGYLLVQIVAWKTQF